MTAHSISFSFVFGGCLIYVEGCVKLLLQRPHRPNILYIIQIALQCIFHMLVIFARKQENLLSVLYILQKTCESCIISVFTFCVVSYAFKIFFFSHTEILEAILEAIHMKRMEMLHQTNSIMYECYDILFRVCRLGTGHEAMECWKFLIPSFLFTLL